MSNGNVVNTNIMNNNFLGKETSIRMDQLELRTYSRQEIAEILDVDINDTNHFKRNVESKLNKWGYSYEYSKRQFKILKVPTSADERLSEIMMRYYDMDIRIDTISFASFLYSLVMYPEFNAMPWEERSKWLEEEFKVSVSDRTLRSWCSKFINSGAIVKNNDYKVRWLTGYYNGEKYREIIDGNKELEQFANEYFEYKKQLLYTYKDLPQSEKWKKTLSLLWEKYKCCIYYCKGIQFSAWDNKMPIEILQEVIELVDEIAERDSSVETKIVVQQRIEVIEKQNDNNFVF